MPDRKDITIWRPGIRAGLGVAQLRLVAGA
jgi:hypothetical protein